MPTNAPLPGETWVPRDGSRADVDVRDGTTMGEVVYEYKALISRGTLYMLPTEAFLRRYEWEDASDE